MTSEESFNAEKDEGEDFVLAVFAKSVEEAEAYRELLGDHDIPAIIGADEPPKNGSRGRMSRGVPVLVPEAMLDEASMIIADRDESDEFAEEGGEEDQEQDEEEELTEFVEEGNEDDEEDEKGEEDQEDQEEETLDEDELLADEDDEDEFEDEDEDDLEEQDAEEDEDDADEDLDEGEDGEGGESTGR